MAADNPKLYLETSVISYLTARPSRDLIALARQEITREWWEQRNHYELFVSAVVRGEIAKGDDAAIQDRLSAIQRIPILARRREIEALAGQYVENGIVPASSPGDAAHLAFACFYEIDLLATWNFKHLANALVRKRLREFNERAGFYTPIICTPEELLGE